jgi:hypothetical protein
MAGGDLDEAAALLLRPFSVHQLVDGAARGAPGAPEQPQGDEDSKDGIGAGQAEN